MIGGKIDRSIWHLPEEVVICPACQEETIEGLTKVTPSVMRKCMKTFRTILSKWCGKKICVSCANPDLPTPSSTSLGKACLVCRTYLSRYNTGDLCYCCKDSKMPPKEPLITLASEPQTTFIKGESTAPYLSSSSPGKTMKLKGSGGKRRLPVLPCLKEEAGNSIESINLKLGELEKRWLGLSTDRSRRRKSISRLVDPVYRIEQENLIAKLSGRIALVHKEIRETQQELKTAEDLLQRVTEIACDVVKLSHPTGNYTPARNKSNGWSINKRKQPKRRNRRKLTRKERRNANQ